MEPEDQNAAIAEILDFPVKEVIAAAPNGQAEVTEVLMSALPSLADEAGGAVVEGDHLLEKLSQGYVTIGAGDLEAEVIRALVSCLRGYAELATISLLDIRAYANERLAAIG